MRTSYAGSLLLLAALAACGKKDPAPDQGLGAGAAPAPTDSTAMQPTPAPAPVATVPAADTTRPPAAANRRAKTPARDQTQSGVTDATTGASTLGTGVTKLRPDQDQPVTAKGDVLVARWDSTTNNWVYHKVGDTTTIRTPGPAKGDTAFNRQVGDSLKPVTPPSTPVTPADTVLGPVKGDSALKRVVPDSMAKPDSAVKP